MLIINYRIQLQFVVYLLMVLGLGIVWGTVPDRQPSPANRRYTDELLIPKLDEICR